MKNNKIKNRKKIPLRPSHKKNLDNMKLLVSDSEFQEIVKEARRKLHIPENSFGKDISDETTKNWHELIDKESSDAIDNLKDQRITIKNKIKFGEITPQMANKQGRLLFLKLPYNYLAYIPSFIIEKFHLPLNYEYYINRYIIFGTINAPIYNFEQAPMDADETLSAIQSGYKYLSINIYTKLSGDELKQLKKWIKKYGDKIPKYQPLKNIDRDLKIEEWYKNKTFYDYATEKTEQLINKEAAEEFLGAPEKEKQIYDIKRSLKKLRKKRFKKN